MEWWLVISLLFAGMVFLSYCVTEITKQELVISIDDPDLKKKVESYGSRLSSRIQVNNINVSFYISVNLIFLLFSAPGDDSILFTNIAMFISLILIRRMDLKKN